jgi:hypothetical protein
MMRRTTVAILAAPVLLGTAGCAFPQPYEADPTSVYGWQRRQDEIQRREDERTRLCAIMNKDSDRYRRDCTRPGDPIR